MIDWEKVIYEVRPYVYFALAFYSLVISRSSAMMVISGLMILFCAYYVYDTRSKYRAQLKSQKRAVKRVV